MARGKNSTGILSGADAIIDAWLAVIGIGNSPHYKHRQSLQLVAGGQPLASDHQALITNLLNTIERNWASSRATSTTRPSQENWRFTKRLQIAAQNASPEVTLERRIAALTGDEWANQVPTASGLTGPGFDRHRNIDLVERRAADAFVFHELKVASDTPRFAAFEVLLRGLLYVFTRRHLHELGYDQQIKPLLAARMVHLHVLAPTPFYEGADLAWLEAALNAGLQQVLRDVTDLDVTMDFAFTTFPPTFVWPCPDTVLKQALGQITHVYYQDNQA